MKKWVKSEGYGFIDNGGGPDILVRKNDLLKCQFLRVGVSVAFECHVNNGKLVAKKVSLVQSHNTRQSNNNRQNYPFGVMQ